MVNPISASHAQLEVASNRHSHPDPTPETQSSYLQSMSKLESFQVWRTQVPAHYGYRDSEATVAQLAVFDSNFLRHFSSDQGDGKRQEVLIRVSLSRRFHIAP
jgi:hypothetical protein